MSDTPIKASKSNTTAGKDAKRLKANKHITQDLPDRRKEQRLEAEVQRLLAEQQESSLTLEQQVALELVSRGYSFRAIASLNGKVRSMTPLATKLPRQYHYSRWTLMRWRANLPEFAEAYEQALNAYARDMMVETMQLAESLDQVKGLKGLSLVIARDKRIQRTHQIGRMRLPEWQEDNTGGNEVIVYEVGDGWVPNRVVAGSPGQGVDGDIAKAQWQAERDVTPQGATGEQTSDSGTQDS